MERGLLRPPQVVEDVTEVGARVQVERRTRGDVPVLDRHGAETVDVREEVHAAEEHGGRRDQREAQLARRSDGAREIAQRHQVGTLRPATAEGEPERNAARGHGGAERAAQVDPTAPATTLAAGEARAEPLGQDANQRPRLDHVTATEFVEGHLQQLARARGAEERPACAHRLLGHRDRAAPGVGPRIPGIGGRRAAPLPFAVATAMPARLGRGSAASSPLPPARRVGRADEREGLVEEHVERVAVALVLHQGRGERLAQHRTLDPGGRDGGERVEALGDRWADAAAAEILDEGEDAGAHPPLRLADQAPISDRKRLIQGMKEKQAYAVARPASDSTTSGLPWRRRSTQRKPHAFSFTRNSAIPTPRYAIRVATIGLPSPQCATP